MDNIVKHLETKPSNELQTMLYVVHIFWQEDWFPFCL